MMVCTYVLHHPDMMAVSRNGLGVCLEQFFVNVEVDGVPYRRGEVVGPSLADLSTGDCILRGNEIADPSE